MSKGTPIRTFRLDDETWGQVTRLAEEREVSAGDVVRLAIDEYLAND